jgi:hypothetical protein
MQNEMSQFLHKDYIDYFLGLAENCELLLHSTSNRTFVQTNGEEYSAVLKSGLKFPALVLEEIDMKVIGEIFENAHYLISGSFMIVSNAAPKGDFDARVAELDRCCFIGHQIIAKMFYDRIYNQNLGFIKGFDWKSVQASPTGRLADNVYGYIFEYKFNVKASEYFEIDPAVWP